MLLCICIAFMLLTFLSFILLSLTEVLISPQGPELTLNYFSSIISYLHVSVSFIVNVLMPLFAFSIAQTMIWQTLRQTILKNHAHAWCQL